MEFAQKYDFDGPIADLSSLRAEAGILIVVRLWQETTQILLIQGTDSVASAGKLWVPQAQDVPSGPDACTLGVYAHYMPESTKEERDQVVQVIRLELSLKLETLPNIARPLILEPSR